MKPIPKFWTARSERVTDPGGQPFALRMWGWSTASLAEAAELAADRLRSAVERVRTGQDLGRYYPRLPLREETLGELTGPDGALLAVVTRNRYGAEVLNTDRVLIADVDLPPAAGTPGGLLGRLLGRRSQDSGAEDARREQVALDRIGGFAGAHPELGTFVYRTAAGLRVIVTGTGAAPDSDAAAAVLSELDSDPVYVRLCAATQTYRARLTPKPWRCGWRRMTVGWPPEDDRQQERAQRWQQGYAARSAGYATCRRISSSGEQPSIEEAMVLELHDGASGVAQDLPLA